MRLELPMQFVVTIEKVDVDSSHYVCSVRVSCSSGIPAVIGGSIGLAFSSQMTVQISSAVSSGSHYKDQEKRGHYSYAVVLISTSFGTYYFMAHENELAITANGSFGIFRTFSQTIMFRIFPFMLSCPPGTGKPMTCLYAFLASKKSMPPRMGKASVL